MDNILMKLRNIFLLFAAICPLLGCSALNDTPGCGSRKTHQAISDKIAALALEEHKKNCIAGHDCYPDETRRDRLTQIAREIKIVMEKITTLSKNDEKTQFTCRAEFYAEIPDDIIESEAKLGGYDPIPLSDEGLVGKENRFGFSANYVVLIADNGEVGTADFSTENELDSKVVKNFISRTGYLANNKYILDSRKFYIDLSKSKNKGELSEVEKFSIAQSEAQLDKDKCYGKYVYDGGSNLDSAFSVLVDKTNVSISFLDYGSLSGKRIESLPFNVGVKSDDGEVWTLSCKRGGARMNVSGENPASYELNLSDGDVFDFAKEQGWIAVD